MLENQNNSEMIKKSLVSIGNNSRFQRALRKTKDGEPVTIVFTGGSITSGYLGGGQGNFAGRTFEYFKDQFGIGTNVTYKNSGYPGANSILGLIKAEQDILEYQPDIVVVEFAVNDTKERVSREAFESLILRILRSENEPAVILLFSITEAGYTCQGHMQAIGEHYQLPMISCGDALMPEISVGRLTWSDFCSDYIHPHEKGHRLLSEFMIYYFNQAGQEEVDLRYELPSVPLFGWTFADIKLLDGTNAIVEQLGGFKEMGSCINFNSGWKHIKGLGNESFRLILKCKNLFIVHKETNQNIAGNAEVYVDGNLIITLHGFRIMGFDNPVVNLLLEEDMAREHVIEIKMAQGDEEKEFSLMAFGYSE